MKLIVALVGATLTALAATSCSSSDSSPSNEELAATTCQTAVANKMKDPDSAQFRNVTTAEAGANFDDSGVYWKVSGEVNAKNGFGGMAGYSGFRCEATLPNDGGMFASYVNVD